LHLANQQLDNEKHKRRSLTSFDNLPEVSNESCSTDLNIISQPTKAIEVIVNKASLSQIQLGSMNNQSHFIPTLPAMQTFLPQTPTFHIHQQYNIENQTITSAFSQYPGIQMDTFSSTSYISGYNVNSVPINTSFPNALYMNRPVYDLSPLPTLNTGCSDIAQYVEVMIHEDKEQTLLEILNKLNTESGKNIKMLIFTSKTETDALAKVLCQGQHKQNMISAIVITSVADATVCQNMVATFQQSQNKALIVSDNMFHNQKLCKKKYVYFFLKLLFL
jgi:hypothetical protein